MSAMFRKPAPEPLRSPREVNGVIILLMSIDDGVLRIAQAVEDDDGGEEEEDEP